MKQQATIMVVDDSRINLCLMEAMLTPENYNIILCDSGEYCLESVLKSAPDIILLDILMSGLDGFQVLRQLKAEEKTQRIPVIVVTSLYEVKYRVIAIEAGAADFLSKPVVRRELLAKVRYLLKEKAYIDNLIAGH